MECKNLKAVLHFQIWKAKDKKKERNYFSIPEMEGVQRSLNEIQELRLRKKMAKEEKKNQRKEKNIEEWTQTKFECRCKLMRKKQTRRIFFFLINKKKRIRKFRRQIHNQVSLEKTFFSLKSSFFYTSFRRYIICINSGLERRKKYESSKQKDLEFERGRKKIEN